MTMLVTLDIETECGVGCNTKCDHALDFNRNRISVIGAQVEENGKVQSHIFRDLDVFHTAMAFKWNKATLIGHNLIGFDLKTLKAKGIDLTNFPVEDTQLMLLAHTEKVSEAYLEQYEAARKERNKLLPKGQSHREAGRYSLKTSAPYFLGVPAFWEATGSKDDDQYVLRDVDYTRRLYSYLLPRLKDEGTYEFYRKKLIPWAFMLQRAEYTGISIDLEKVDEKALIAELKAQQAKEKLDEQWAEAYQAYKRKQIYEIREENKRALDSALLRLKQPTIKDEAKKLARFKEKVQRVRDRYADSLRFKEMGVQDLNLDSPTQLTWLLRDHLGYDIKDYSGEETTGIEVLERLAAEGKQDVATFIEYRRQQKLCTAFFPSYREFAHDGVIHCSFNITGTRTGRLSSSRPNLQQQPPECRDCFVARPGYSLVSRDEAGVEPVVAGYYSRDPILCDLLIRGGNFHSFNAPAFFPYIDCPEEEVKKRFPAERDLAKTVGLSLMYGASWRRIQIAAMKAGFRWSKRECQEKYENFKELYRGVFEFKEEILDPMLRSGETVTNLFGRKYCLDPDDVTMKGFNSLVQSSASDLVIHSAYRVEKEFKERGIKGQPLLWVHDELVVEVEDSRLKEAEEIIERCMTDYKLPTPYGNLPLKVEGKTAKVWAK
jgi:DNA polymerase I-like protein with 3'-5' exonuclease and polymerase domains